METPTPSPDDRGRPARLGAHLRDRAALAPARSVVVLFYYEDRPMDQIADILGCTTATGWVHLHKARKRLGVLLGGGDTDVG